MTIIRPKLIPASASPYPPKITENVYEFYYGDIQAGRVKLVPAGMGGWYLADFLIYKRYRKMGCGKKLMESILKLAKRKKKKSIFLWVKADNTAAIKIYEAHGFKRVVDDVVCMYLWLQS